MSLEQVGRLQIGEDLKFQHRQWIVQRVGWVLLSLLLLAALLGLFGDGPLSNARVRDSTGVLEADYQRFARIDAQDTLTVRVAPAAIHDGQFGLWFSGAYLEGTEISRIEPEPVEHRLQADRVSYVFHTGPPDGPLTLTFHLRPRAIGSLPAELGIDGGPSLVFRHFVYP